MPVYEYFRPDNCSQYTFYRIPKVLFERDGLVEISNDAKILYGLLLDRVDLSLKNGWVDADNRVYIIFTQQEIMERLKISNTTASKLAKELENYGLIVKKKQGLGKPDLLYVKDFISRSENSSFLDLKSEEASHEDISSADVKEPHTINTNNNQTNTNNIDPIILSDDSDGRKERERRKAYSLYFQESIGYDDLVKEFPYAREELDLIIALMVDVFFAEGRTIRIGGEDKPLNVVKGQVMKITCDDVRFVLNNIHNGNTEIKNMRSYMMTSLFYAPIMNGQKCDMRALRAMSKQTANGRQEGEKWIQK